MWKSIETLPDDFDVCEPLAVYNACNGPFAVNCITEILRGDQTAADLKRERVWELWLDLRAVPGLPEHSQRMERQNG